MGLSGSPLSIMRSYPFNRPKKQDNSEGRLVMQIIYYLRAKGYICGKTKTMGVMRGGRYTADPYLFTGFPDITAFTPSLVYIECKSPTGRQTPDQKSFQRSCRNADITYILARSLSDVEAVIK